jgi:hypothetical protein
VETGTVPKQEQEAVEQVTTDALQRVWEGVECRLDMQSRELCACGNSLIMFKSI